MRRNGLVWGFIFLIAVAGLWAFLSLGRPAPTPLPGVQACAPEQAPLPQPAEPDEPAIRSAMQAELDRYGAAHADSYSLLLGSIWGQNSWAAGEVHPQPGGGASTEGTLVLAYQVGSDWKAALPGDPAFLPLFEKGPALVLSPGAAAWFRAESTLQYSDTQGIYYMPFAAGTQARVTCFDCYGGHAPSIDWQSQGDLTIRAARAGAVAAFFDAGDYCCCQSACSACNSYIVLDHGDGEYSAYLHIATDSIPPALRQIGVPVSRGAIIALEGDTGYTCGSHRPEVGCGNVTPDPGYSCAQHLHFEVRDQPFPYGTRLRPRFQDVYDQTDPPTYFVQQGNLYTSGNVVVSPTVTPTPSPSVTPTPSPIPNPTPTPGSCPPPVAPEGAYLFTEPSYCGPYASFVAPAPALTDTVVSTGAGSLYLAGPYTATLFTQPDYAGTSQAFLFGEPDLAGTAVSTHTASISVSLSSCPIISAGVVLYSAPNFGGACQYFSNSVALVSPTISARSLRLVGPYGLALYSQAGFTGTMELFYGSTPDLSWYTISHTVASLVLGALPCNPRADGITLFSSPGYTGTCQTFVSSAADLSLLVHPVSSISLRGPFQAVLYSEPGYTGTAETFLMNDSNLADNAISTTARSLAVVPIECRPWSEGVTLFAGRDLSGACLTLTGDDPELADEALTGQIRSLQIRGPYRATLYSLPFYSGTSEVFDRTDPDLGDNRITTTASVRVAAVTCTAGLGGVTLWAGPGYNGPCSTFRAPDPDLADNGIGAGSAFSLRTIGAYSVSLYPAVNFAGMRFVALGDLPDLKGSEIGTGTLSIRVEALSETPRLWNNLRGFPFPLELTGQPVVYLQDMAPANADASDPLLPCTGVVGTRTLWYRPLFSETAILHASAGTAGAAPTLALWLEQGGNLRSLGCVTGDGAVLEALLPTGSQVLLEVVTAEEPGGVLSLSVTAAQTWKVYLPIVLK